MTKTNVLAETVRERDAALAELSRWTAERDGWREQALAAETMAGRLRVELTTMRDENDTLRRLLKTARFDADVRLGAMNEANERRLAMSDERDAAQTENEVARLNCKAMLNNARRHEEVITARLAAITPIVVALLAYERAPLVENVRRWRAVEVAIDDLPADVRAELEEGA